jgi:hypothetical protein
MAIWTKIYSLWRQPTKRTNLAEATYLPYFNNDNFPLQWHDAISKSPSAASCVSTIQDFLEGSGFDPDELEKLIVNAKGETFFQVHQKTCKDFGEFEGFYWLLRFNALGKVTEWEVLPFENCRLGKPDSSGYISKIYYNPYFGTADYTTINKETTVYDVYSPTSVRGQMQAQKDKFKGQVYFCGTTNALSRFYPMPSAHSAFEWFEIEAGVKIYHKENIKNGLLTPYILIKYGDPNAPANNPEADSTEKAMTLAEAFDEVISENFMGAERVGNLMVHWVSNKEEKPDIVPLPSNATGDNFLALDQQATKKITVAFKVPAILANINEGVSLGGDGNMIRVAVKLMQQRMVPKQRILTDKYEMILSNFTSPYTQPISITPYNPYPELEVLDDKIWGVMSREEQRDWVEEKTDIILLDPAVQVQPQRPLNAIPVGFPDKVRNGVKKVLDFNDKMGVRCISRASRTVSEDIVNNHSMGFKQLKRIHSYLKKNEGFKNSLISENCEALKYHAWGGREMFDFLDSKLKDVDQWLN